MPRAGVFTTLLAVCGCGGSHQTFVDPVVDTVTTVGIDEVGPHGFSGRELIALLPTSIVYDRAVADSDDGFGAGDPLEQGAPFEARLRPDDREAEVFTRTVYANVQTLLRVRVELEVVSEAADLAMSGSLYVAAIALDWEAAGWMQDRLLLGPIPEWTDDAIAGRIGESRCATETDDVVEHGEIGVELEGALATPRLGLSVEWDDEVVNRDGCHVRREFIDVVTLSAAADQ